MFAIVLSLFAERSVFMDPQISLLLTSCSVVDLQVKLLKDILEAWKKEVEKKPSTLTIDEAYDTLKVKKDPSG